MNGTMNLQSTIALLLSGLLSLLSSQLSVAAEENLDRPNIVFILADDLGYGDLGCYGHPTAKTPHLDRLAKQGVKFTQHYANGPECSPTRTAFLTGKYQQRAGGLECAIGTGNVGRYDDAIRLANKRQLGLPAPQSILPRAMKQAGYTCGIFGKWHLGYEPEFNPIVHGWDEFFGYLGGNVDYFTHRETSDLHVLFRGKLPIYRPGYMTHLITDDSIAFINKHKQHPFFLYVAHECPHFPYQGPNDQDKVVNETNWNVPDAETYIAMLEDLDKEVGRLLTAIDQGDLAKNTVVVFASDNGGIAASAHQGGLRGSKSSTFEGGIRAPLIIRWPGHIEPNSISHQVSATFDLTASFLKLAQANPGNHQLDGYDIIGHITEGRQDVSRTLFWRGKRGERTWWGVRDGDLKYVRKADGGQTEDWLFNLSNDRGEQTNLIKTQADAAAKLKQKLTEWEQDVKAVR